MKNLRRPPVAERDVLCTGTSSLAPFELLLPFTPCSLSTSSVILVHVVRVVFVPSCICISSLTAHTSTSNTSVQARTLSPCRTQKRERRLTEHQSLMRIHIQHIRESPHSTKATCGLQALPKLSYKHITDTVTTELNQYYDGSCF